MKKSKLIICFLCLALLLGLSACGEAEPETGKYICRSILKGGETLPVKGSGGEIILDKGGAGLFRFDEREGSIRWSAEGEKLTLHIGGEDMAAELKDERISLPLEDNINAVFYKVGTGLPPELQPVQLRDMYGWWRITDSEGEMPETWIDLCAAFDEESSCIIFYDEDGSLSEPMGEIELYYKPYGDIPQYRSRRGYFWYTHEHDNNFIIKEDEHGAYTVSGGAVDKDGEIFSYEIYLRPWGDMWLWEQDEQPELLPYYFNEWYLPLAEAGEDMPEKIN